MVERNGGDGASRVAHAADRVAENVYVRFVSRLVSIFGPTLAVGITVLALNEFADLRDTLVVVARNQAVILSDIERNKRDIADLRQNVQNRYTDTDAQRDFAVRDQMLGDLRERIRSLETSRF